MDVPKNELLNSLCTECKRNDNAPECWGQYGNPCAKYLDEMERLEIEAQEVIRNGGENQD